MKSKQVVNFIGFECCVNCKFTGERITPLLYKCKLSGARKRYKSRCGRYKRKE